MQSYMAVAHFAVDFRFRHQCGNGVHDDNINGAAAHQGIHDIQSLFTGIRLGNQEFVNIYAQFLRVYRV